ncbi:hypothetical protein [Roseitranquillus sediminis]|uniref:hypothetical protein n=1 Tax=Roseitranquillus sediminis TaxID=2809051 RepID=UPI001D0CDC9A|nr:hypothetical protein [Roseitranquillus sediminis]MBM9596464.1 hypothetical protein [Roseitranquillus sediminis]
MSGERPPFAVELGWIVTSQIDPSRRGAVEDAADHMKRTLSEILPGYDWRVGIAERIEPADRGPAEPVLLLDTAERERDRRNWDFVFVLTERELKSYTRSVTVAAPAQAYATAIVSLARLTDREDEAEVLSRRLYALSMHLFGRLNGLGPRESGFMCAFTGPRGLDGMNGFAEDEKVELRAHLDHVADPRVEETGKAGGRVGFYVRSLWENRRSLPKSILRMRPWAFPLRLSRLTTAAGSALAVLVMTAETWEVAANLAPPAVATLSAVALIGTSGYLLRAQRLLARSGESAMREQRAVINVSTVLAVALGMAVTYVAIFALALAGGHAFFGDPLLASWTGERATGDPPLRPMMAGYIAALSLVIGALGASFEPHGYFRNVTHIDEEL